GLRERGIEASALPQMPPARELARLAREVDAVCVQKRRLPLAHLLHLRRAAAALLFDFDDAIWLQRRPDRSVRPAPAVKRLRLAAILRLSHRVIAGNRYLEAYARRFSRSVTVLPTPVDLGRFAPAPGSRLQAPGPVKESSSPPGAWSLEPGAAVRLGWVGHADNLVYLRDLEPVFRS